MPQNSVPRPPVVYRFFLPRASSLPRILARLCRYFFCAVGFSFVVTGCKTETHPAAPQTLQPARDAACAGDWDAVLIATTDAPEPLAVQDRIVLGRYRAMAAHKLGHEDTFLDARQVTHSLETAVVGPLPTEMILEFAEASYWTIPDKTNERLFREALSALDHLLPWERFGLEPTRVGIVGCERKPRRSIAQARAFARLRIGTIALTNRRCEESEAYLTQGIAELERAGEMDHGFGGQSVGALLFNNYSEHAIYCDEAEHLAVSRRLKALRLAEAAGAELTLGTVSGGLAFLGTPERSFWSDPGAFLASAVIAQHRVETKLTAAKAGERSSLLGLYAKVVSLRAWFEGRMCGGEAGGEIRVWVDQALEAAEQSGTLYARLMTPYFCAQAFAAMGDVEMAEVVFGRFLGELPQLWMAAGSGEDQTALYKNVEEWLQDTLLFAVFHERKNLVFEAMERSKDIGLLQRYQSLEFARRGSHGPTGAPPFTPLPEVARFLQSGEALLHLDILTETQTLVLLWIENDQVVIATTDATELNQNARTYRELLQLGPECSEEDKTRRDELGKTLTHTLLGPFLRELGCEELWMGGVVTEKECPPGSRRLRRLLWVPRGELHSVPFATLPFAQGTLLNVVSTAIVPNASHLVLLKNRAKARQTPQNAVALVVDTTQFPADREKQLLGLGETPSPQLYETVEEVTRGIFAKWVYVKAHGIYNTENPGESVLQLVAEGTSDGKMRLREIASTKIQSDVVILQSCEAARTETAPGDQMDNIARAFLSAGATAVIAPLWELPVTTTEQITPLLADWLRHTESGVDAAEGLRSAQLRMKSRGGIESDPSVWGIYVVTGYPGDELGL